MASPCATFLSAPRHDSRLIQNSDSAADSEGDEFFTQVETHFGSQYEVLETANCGYSADGTAHAGTTRAQARPAQIQTFSRLGLRLLPLLTPRGQPWLNLSRR